jgi:hypothetical protein
MPIARTVDRVVIAKNTNRDQNEIAWPADVNAWMWELFLTGGITLSATAPTDLTQIWYQPNALNSANGSFKVYEGGVWQALTAALFARWLTARSGVAPGSPFPGPAYNNKIVMMPTGGTYVGAAAVNGAIRIKLPKRRSATLVKFKLSVIELDAEVVSDIDQIEFEISGYINSADNTWLGLQARITSGAPIGHTYFVSAGEDATNAIIWIYRDTYDFAAAWAWPQLQVMMVQTGIANDAAADWSTGWTTEIVTAYAGTETVGNTVTAASGGGLTQALADTLYATIGHTHPGMLTSVAVTAPVAGNGTAGSPINVPAAVASGASGLLTGADKAKLDGITPPVLTPSSVTGTGVGAIVTTTSSFTGTVSEGATGTGVVNGVTFGGVSFGTSRAVVGGIYKMLGYYDGNSPQQSATFIRTA